MTIWLIIIGAIFGTSIVISIYNTIKAKKTPAKNWVNPQDAIENYIDVVSMPIEGIARKQSFLKYTIEEIFECWNAYLNHKYNLSELINLEGAFRSIYLQKNNFIEDLFADRINVLHFKKIKTSEEKKELDDFLAQLHINEVNNDFNTLYDKLKDYKKSDY